MPGPGDRTRAPGRPSVEREIEAVPDPGIALSFYLAAVPAVVLLGLSKGGFSGVGLLSLPLLALVISPIRAAGIILPILIAQDALTVYVYRRSWDARNLRILLPGAIGGVLLGYLFAARVSDGMLSLLVGTLAGSFAIRRLGGGRIGIGSNRINRPFGILCGALSGFASMIANAGTPPFQIYMLPQRLSPALLVGTSAVFFAATNMMKVIPFAALGQFNEANLVISVSLLPVAIASNMAGINLVRRVSAKRFYRLIYLLLVAVSLKLVWDGASSYLI